MTHILSTDEKSSSPVVDVTGRTLIDYLKTEFEPNAIGIDRVGAPVMRYRPPYNQTFHHDTKPDGLQLVIDNLTQRRLPINVAYVVALNYIKKYAREFQIEDVPFDDSDDVPVRDGAQWAKNILDEISPYCLQVIERQVEIEGLPQAWWSLPVSSATDKGRRKEQEDRMIVLPTLQFHLPYIKDPVSLLGVFDGHGGSSIASYAAAHLPFEIGLALDQSPNDRSEALLLAMKSLDKRITARCRLERWGGRGSTAVVALLDEKMIHIRWLGDSNAYLLSSTGVELLTEPHTPRNQKEADRIREAGGELLYIQGELRVNGVLNLTRSLGDISGRPMISGESDGVSIERVLNQYLIMFMSDGVCEGIKLNEFFDLIREFVNQNVVEDYHDLAEYLVQAAINLPSNDNCTCVIAFLRPPSDLWKLFGKLQLSDEEEEKIE